MSWVAKVWHIVRSRVGMIFGGSAVAGTAAGAHGFDWHQSVQDLSLVAMIVWSCVMIWKEVEKARTERKQRELIDSIMEDDDDKQ